MAKRRKLSAPSTEDLTRMEEEFRRETSSASAMAPIAQVAAEAARSVPVTDPDVRAENARSAVSAKVLRDSEAAGLLIREIPLEQISPEDMVRDRAILAEDEMMELRTSIAANGLRLPIELYVFSGDKDWINYEGIQADIFDHLFASLPFFELRPFQNRTGADLSAALRAKA